MGPSLSHPKSQSVQIGRVGMLSGMILDTPISVDIPEYNNLAGWRQAFGHASPRHDTNGSR